FWFDHCHSQRGFLLSSKTIRTVNLETCRTTFDTFVLLFWVDYSHAAFDVRWGSCCRCCSAVRNNHNFCNLSCACITIPTIFTLCQRTALLTVLFSLFFA